MKTLITVTTLLALTTPAFAAKAKPQDFPDIRKWEDLDFQCYRGVFPDDDADIRVTKEEYDKSAREKVCIAAEALGKKLVARGYCLYGKGNVGKAGRKYFYPGIDSAGTNSGWTRHCYTITNVPERLD